MAHAVDVPVTDLNEDEHDISTLDSDVLREDFEMDDDAVLRPESPFAKFTGWLSALRPQRYTPVADFNLRGIELDRLEDRTSFDLSDEEFILRRQQKGLVPTLLELWHQFKTVVLGVMILLLLIVVGILGGLLSKRKHPLPTLLSNGTHTFQQTTILISLDGFHPHYISQELTPTLHELLSNGYGAPYMIPSFPSSTFPNHWTMATGLYPESHGIVGNTFFDPTTNKTFVNKIPAKSLDPVWWGGEPIWSTAELQGVKSAIHMYPGSEVVLPKGNPTDVDKFNGTEKLEVKTERILGWLDRDIKKRPQLIIGYVPTIDSLGHKHGVHGEELEKGLKYVDTFIHSLTEGISQRNATEIVNLIVVSDHGMAPTSNDRLIYLDDSVNTTKIEHVDGWPLYGLRPFAEFTVDEVYQELQDSFQQGEGYNVYLKEELPSEWNFGHGPYADRIAPIWVVPDVGFSITTHDDMERKEGQYAPHGVHGYNNTEVLMRAIFLGDGPYFHDKLGTNLKVEPFENVEVYGIVCDTLGLKHAVNNGTGALSHALAEKWRDPWGYPGVGFDVGMLPEKASYDLLYRPDERQTTTSSGSKSGEVKTEKTETKSAEVKTKAKSAEVKSAVNTVKAKSSSATTQQPHTATNTPESKQSSSTTTATTKHGFFDKIEQIGEDLLDDIEDALEEAEEFVEDHIS